MTINLDCGPESQCHNSEVSSLSNPKNDKFSMNFACAIQILHFLVTGCPEMPYFAIPKIQHYWNANHGDPNHGNSGKYPDSRKAVRCPEEYGLTLRPPGQWPRWYTFIRA